MEEIRNHNDKGTQELIEVTDNTALFDVSEHKETAEEIEAGKQERYEQYVKQQKAIAREGRTNRTLLMVLAGVLGVARLAALLVLIWIISTQLSFVVASPDSAGMTASSGIVNFAGRSIISSELEEKLAAIKSRIDMYFLFDKSDADFETGILKGYVDALKDPYTVYYTPDEFKELMESTTGRFNGIGVVVQQNATGSIVVVRPYLTGPAYAAGIRADDIIYKVNGEEVTGQDLSLVVSRIKGEPGTTVDLTIYRPMTNEYIDITVERAEIEVETITHEMLEDGIGRISMSSFEEVTYKQFMEAFHELKNEGMRGLIIDLRDNGGGLLDTATNILDALLPSGVLTYTEDRDGNREYYRSGASAELDMPCVVLVNGYSASASEIFTGVMKDYKAATIVGTKTFGKGIVQVILTLSDGSALKVTTSRYYLPSGICIHEVGIEPDVVVEKLTDPDSTEDVQLQKAIEVLKEQTMN